MLLFVDQEYDAHADWVEAECHRRDIPYLRLCTERFPRETQLIVKIDQGEIGGVIRQSDQEVLIETITGVWFRRPGDVTLHPDMDKVYERFAYMESEETLNGLYRALWDRRWVSPPHRVRAANHKINQLRLANRLGFQTVPTIVTNDPDEALAFFHLCDRQMVYKPLRQVAIAYDDGTAYGVYTTLITQANLDRHLDSIRLIPCLFQQFIPKQYELRVNVIGNRVWTTAIYTQEAEHTKLDFRPHTSDCRHEPVLLPAHLEAACLDLTHHLGLRMGNIDMIVTPGGEYVFLEINPNGQWAWIEDMVGFPLCTALVDELMGVDTLADHPYLRDGSLIFAPNTAIKEYARETAV